MRTPRSTCVGSVPAGAPAARRHGPSPQKLPSGAKDAGGKKLTNPKGCGDTRAATALGMVVAPAMLRRVPLALPVLVGTLADRHWRSRWHPARRMVTGETVGRDRASRRSAKTPGKRHFCALTRGARPAIIPPAPSEVRLAIPEVTRWKAHTSLSFTARRPFGSLPPLAWSRIACACRWQAATRKACRCWRRSACTCW